ncbi:MAG: UDP-N-acetylmuramate:L-alanyl-gamma-D-glutamyl-meso-diaminopimelate ligase [Thiomargarita sp.]|nr:UDP-N-acetylmuramate:L-alanyl-gamma-D-glutamyl-meso-diaminopimelate ligase [Thiomargarita sp.]
MHIHILGICGTFMAGIAVLAKQQGHTVTGSDKETYPPMSTQLESLGITLFSGYSANNLKPKPDCVIIGNVLSRGNPEVEAVFNLNLSYISGPQWLAEHVLAKRWVLAVAGTHGKTTTASLLAWILESAGLSPGFLIGGVPENFGISARLGDRPFFVVEADEYDTAFFDKRSKFVHYHPRTLVLNNLEFDHADIFPDLAAIQRQFHHLIRTVPGNGLIVYKNKVLAINALLQQGCWTPLETLGEGDWDAKPLCQDYSQFDVFYKNEQVGTVKWNLIGQYNVQNALAAIASAHHAGVSFIQICESLETFRSVKRRLELRGVVKGIRVYDDFAHHPTAIAVTIEALRQRVGKERIIAVLEPRSNTMRMGIHKNELMSSLQKADIIVLSQSINLNWSLHQQVKSLDNAHVFNRTTAMIEYLLSIAQSGDHILVMSNGSFDNIHARLLEAL